MAKKIRLTKEQKRWHENLAWYLKNKVQWAGEQNLKETVLDGNYAVLHAHDKRNIFDVIVCTDSIKDTEIILKWNKCKRMRIIDLEYLDTIKDVHIYNPNWTIKERN